jgi:acyl-CoA synthetase (AMP-forming)/AMP-acid ligase II
MPDLLTSLAEHARRTPRRAAIVEPDGLTTTWADLHTEVCAQAARLKAVGGTHVIVALTGANSLFAYLAVQAAGLVPILVGPNTAALIPRLQGHFQVGTTISEPLGPALGGTVEIADRPDQAVGAIQFSTGSTGTPKGMIRTVQAEYFDALGRCLAMSLRPGDTWLSIEAANPNIALGAFRCVLLLGGTLLLTDSTTPTALEERTRNGITVLPLQSHDWRRAVAAGLPAVLVERGLRVAAITGGHADPRTLAELDTALDGRGEVLNVYGLTECGTVAVAGRHERSGGGPFSVGRLVPTLHADLAEIGRFGGLSSGEMSDAGVLTDIAAPTVVRETLPRGEIRLCGPAVANRYLLARADGLWEVEATTGGWLTTGDIGAFGPDGDLRLFGRLHDVIEAGGIRLLPRELELALETHLDAAEVLVLPYRPNPTSPPGAAVIVHGSPADAPHILALLRAALADRPEIGHALITENLPRNAGGKTDRAHLSAALVDHTLAPTPLLPTASTGSPATTPPPELTITSCPASPLERPLP